MAPARSRHMEPGAFARPASPGKNCWACAVQAMAQEYEAAGPMGKSRGLAPAGASPWSTRMGRLAGLALACEGAAAADWGIFSSAATAPAPAADSAVAAALSLLRSVLHIPALLLGTLLLVATLNAARSGKPEQPFNPAPTDPADERKYAQILSKAIQCKTISRGANSGIPTDYSQFDALRAHLRKSFPAVFSQLEVHEINTHSLAIEWRGSDRSLKPWLLCAHQDVVSTEGQAWADVEHFGGMITKEKVQKKWTVTKKDGSTEEKSAGVGELEKDGSTGKTTIWGRGAIDDKNNLIAQLGAVEELLQAGFKPKRTLWMAFGHDEEVGGVEGAAHIGRFFRDDKKLSFSFLVDEGTMILTDAPFPGLSGVTLALVGCSEKGYLDVKVTCEGAPGHSALPLPGDTSITVMGKAIAALHSTPMPAHFDSEAPMRKTLDGMAPYMSFPWRILMSNLWLSAPLVKAAILSKGGAAAAMLRTTTVMTIAKAGDKANVVPPKGELIINHRLHPYDTAAEVLAHDRKVLSGIKIKDPYANDESKKPLQIAAEPAWHGPKNEASPVQRGPNFDLIAATNSEVYGVATVPSIMVAATDTPHYVDLCDEVYRFSPLRLHMQDPSGIGGLEMFHGEDERITASALVTQVAWYRKLVESACSK